jgi:acetate kinase
LAFLGITVDMEMNAMNAPVISMPSGAVTVRVMHTDEELMVARHTHHVMMAEHINGKRGQQAA